MKLELASFPVEDVKFSKQTSYNNGVLEIDKEELVALILRDSKIASADLDIAFPGEQTRIVKVRDAVILPELRENRLIGGQQALPVPVLQRLTKTRVLNQDIFKRGQRPGLFGKQLVQVA